MKQYLAETSLLNFSAKEIQNLIEDNSWRNLDKDKQINAVYDFVRDAIVFGYNEKDDLAASKILEDGYGQCNTKSILLMALLRALDIPCRLHGFYIDKRMQKGALTGLVYMFAPKSIVHAWTEILYNEEWIVLEGVIIDSAFLQNAKSRLCRVDGKDLGYGISVINQREINVCWEGKSTYIQSASITNDLGIFSNPDIFFAAYQNKGNFIKQTLFNILRKRINHNIERIRRR